MIKFYSKAAISAVLASLTLTTISCQKDLPDNSGNQPQERVPLKVNVNSDIRTKATLNETGESTINKIEIFVFNSDTEGRLDVYGSFTDQTDMTLNCTTGDKDIYALVNGAIGATTLKSIDTKEKFLATTTLLQDNEQTNFVMIGSKSESISAATQVEVPVSRIVSRIGIGKIKTDFTAPAYKNMEFIVKKIYVLNAVNSTDLGLSQSPTADNFFNFKRATGQCDALLAYKTEFSLENGGSKDVDQYFYTLPNPTTDDCQDSTNSARFTRLVIETTLGGTTYYYPISIIGSDGKLSANQSFMIKSLTITRPGSLSPDEPFEIAASALTLDITSWDSTEGDKTI